MGPKTKTLLLIKAMVAVLLFHFLPEVVEERRLRKRTEGMRKRFNLMLLEDGESKERLRMLKALINNARHCRHEDIPLDGSVEDVRKAYCRLEIRSSKVFLRLSSVYNLSIFSPVFLPVVIQSLVILRHRCKRLPCINGAGRRPE